MRTKGQRFGSLAAGARAGPWIAAAGALFLATVAYADEVESCAGPAYARGTAQGASDGHTVRLTEGPEIRLAQVIGPSALDGNLTPADRAAKLDTLIRGRSVALHARTHRSDRYGRPVAQLRVQSGDKGETWLQAELVGAGLVRVAPATDDDCAGPLLALERRARASGVGLWGESQFAVFDADAIDALVNAAGRYVIVQGRVRRVGEAGNRLFLDFGRRFTRDFSVVVPAEARKAFSAAGLELQGLRERLVRVRGVLYLWGGPAIELRVPAALELVGAEGA